MTNRSTAIRRWVALAGALIVAGLFVAAGGQEAATPVPRARLDNPKTAGPLQTAVLAGGCFWGVQGVYQHVRGVREVRSGYAGGAASTAKYESVGTGRTGHAESVRIKFDPQQISYGELLQIYFSVAHDPTQLNRQGPDTGTQYRSAIFYLDDAQQKIAQAYVRQLDAAKVFQRPIVTRIDAYSGFYAAESYHQDFLLNHPRNPYIAINDLPKIRNLEQLFPAVYRDPPISANGRVIER